MLSAAAGRRKHGTRPRNLRMTSMNYRIVIGLEVHVQLLTRTKLFCGCSTQFGLPPNSATCPICIGMPGVLPVMNRAAFDLALRAALALNCTVADFTKWDRKNYYYPDLPKNYQISQYDLPFSRDGRLEVDTANGPKRVGIIRVHLEEDAKATAGWDEARGVTVVQRRKEEAADYRYFPEPDLAPVAVDAAWRERARVEMGELPAAQRVRLVSDYGLSAYDAGVLTRQG